MVLLNVVCEQSSMEYDVLWLNQAWLLNTGLMQFKQLFTFETLFPLYDNQKQFQQKFGLENIKIFPI